VDEPLPLTPSRLVWRGLRRRCPMCGRRGIFEGWFAQRDRCPACNFPTARVADQWLGAYGMNVLVSFSLLAVSIGVGFAVTYPDPPVAVLLVVLLTTAAVFPVVFYPVAKSLWAAIDLAMRPPEPSDDIDPRFLPPRRR